MSQNRGRNHQLEPWSTPNLLVKNRRHSELVEARVGGAGRRRHSELAEARVRGARGALSELVSREVREATHFELVSRE